ncbi:MAG: hypothetical protein IPM37_03440 [Hahellaceae bacterium]|nr:hypothetical protein [Hahellaceae bacterium]
MRYLHLIYHVAGQMRAWGSCFPYTEVDINPGVLIGMAIVFFYAVLGGRRKGITHTQVAQYWRVMIVAL